LPRTYQHVHMYEGAREEELPEEKLWEAQFLPSCGMLVRRKLFEEGLYFDEGMFVYHNDVDFCLKARRTGWKVVVVRDAKMWHKVSGTVGVYSPMMIYYKGRNKILLFKRYGKMRDLPYFVGFHMKKAFSIFRSKRSLAGMGSMMRALLHGIRGVKE